MDVALMVDWGQTMIPWRTSWRALLIVFLAQFSLRISVSAQSLPLPDAPPLSIFDVAGVAYNLDPALLKAIARVESGGRVEAVSPKGASGLMQLMPETARRFGVQDPFDPVQNVVGAARFLAYLRQYARIEDLPQLLAAYNAGEGAVAHYGGIPPYAETHEYVRRVLFDYFLGVRPPQSSLIEAGSPDSHRTSVTGGHRSFTRLTPDRLVVPGTGPRAKVHSVVLAPESVKQVTDADVLDQLEQIRRARKKAVENSGGGAVISE
jgi:hypothetical protein